jgi:hypothetical protein
LPNLNDGARIVRGKIFFGNKNDEISPKITNFGNNSFANIIGAFREKEIKISQNSPTKTVTTQVTEL